MKAIYPSFIEPRMNISLQSIRLLSKLIYSTISPVNFCRADTRHNNSLFDIIVEAAKNKQQKGNKYCPTEFSLDKILVGVTKLYIPPIQYSATSSPSPSTSPSPTSSPSATPSHSSLIQMCGKSICKNIGSFVSMFRQLPSGWCLSCGEGTSGPCRDVSTNYCYDFIYGSECSANQLKCSLIPNSSQSPTEDLLECPFTGDLEQSAIRFLIRTPYTTNWASSWGMILASAIADVIHVDDLCTFRIHISPSDTNQVKCVVIVYQPTQDESVVKIRELDIAITDMSLLKQLKRRGLDLDDIAEI
eukprot:c20959_g1_i2.p1 GENE.c20959_g1_i2~~c20959_g1_i2.p1  ORF type:complete len:302 (+),score=104.50 c20959_g1_i2:174-1079(+)